jgi:hypothetical protein
MSSCTLTVIETAESCGRIADGLALPPAGAIRSPHLHSESRQAISTRYEDIPSQPAGESIPDAASQRRSFNDENSHLGSQTIYLAVNKDLYTNQCPTSPFPPSTIPIPLRSYSNASPAQHNVFSP